MAAGSGKVARTRSTERFVHVVAAGVGLVFVVAGVWAFVAPRSFFDNAVTFEPYNTHFIRDLGAFQLGLGAVLLLGTWARDALFAALAGVAVGAVAHLVGHIVDRDAGGQPAVDTAVFGLVAGLLVVATVVRARLVRD